MLQKTVTACRFLNVNIGLPYFSRILIKNPNSAEIESLFINEIANSPGVTAIEEFAMSYIKETRKLLVTARIDSVAGVISFSEEVP